MTVNIYDDINRLEMGFKQTEQFEALVAAVEVVKADEDAQRLFVAFRDMQMELQQQQAMGVDMTEEQLTEAQQVAEQAQTNEKIMAMLQAEMQLSEVLNEVNRILVKPIQDLYNGL
ncbi:YlbF family regulator [Savagea sp. SN6]|uniref:UPF0342 protein IRY55_11485 n=1 Tax=Savagea serpentis TaxID=2785297 RepID=A0A8J7KLZ9_9BACL|nr:YlbF family regulator [Savagea serpentis]MBF4501979.1 YlbF family regulator [Savagea serpentis]